MTIADSNVARDDAKLAQATFELLAGGAAEPLPRHRHQLSRDEVLTSQTARILAAAVELFGDSGYAETTVAQIADRAGVSRRTVYDLYDSKEAIFLHTYRCTQLLISAAARTDQDQEGEPELTLATLPASVNRLLAVIAAAPAAARMFFLEALGAGPRVRARRNEAIAEFVSGIAPLLQQLHASSETSLPPLSLGLCNAVVAGAIELIVQHLAHKGAETVVELSSTIIELICAVVTPNYQ
ncbi:MULTISPECIES: TetR/AcrR family transcriptional regulator [unclassified Mycobacteroides]|uniref:TetR/AcrR family transcriptional regulator n=1 Tax=unclassified Mycobacteroides TaxID=2618759 RepID=UPI001396C40C|nr:MULTISPECIES: TetR/AcrR family transcriptional regulator [unclassified Mycobacteroides]